MGMPIVVDVRDDGVPADAVERAFDWFREVDEIFSTYKESSDISRLNRGELSLGDAHRDVRTVLALCEEMRLATNGYFDVHASAPDSIDPSGLVKGWSVDRAAELLEEAGARNYAINAGGDMRIAGRAVPELDWRIGIEHPLERDRIAAVVATGHGAIATSGAYIRGEHVLDPHTGQPPTGVLSVTITGPVLAVADAYATAAFAMGESGPRWTARLRGYEALTIFADERVLSTPRFPRAADD
jgi:thiamine biosynthesis lipoprotein